VWFPYFLNFKSWIYLDSRIDLKGHHNRFCLFYTCYNHWSFCFITIFWRNFDWFKGVFLLCVKNELVKYLKESIQSPLLNSSLTQQNSNFIIHVNNFLDVLFGYIIILFISFMKKKTLGFPSRSFPLDQHIFLGRYTLDNSYRLTYVYTNWAHRLLSSFTRMIEQ